MFSQFIHLNEMVFVKYLASCDLKLLKSALLLLLLVSDRPVAHTGFHEFTLVLVTKVH